MAIARCESCGKPTRNTNGQYAPDPRRPVGHPNSGVVCGRPRCDNAALIWLKENEARAYEKGQRVFDFPTQAAKVRLED